jgi:hypothetical protein
MKGAVLPPPPPPPATTLQVSALPEYEPWEPILFATYHELKYSSYIKKRKARQLSDGICLSYFNASLSCKFLHSTHYSMCLKVTISVHISATLCQHDVTRMLCVMTASPCVTDEYRHREFCGSRPNYTRSHRMKQNSGRMSKIWGFHGDDYEECRLLGFKYPVRTSQETRYFSATESSQLMLCKIWGFHGDDYEECRLLG